MTRKRLPRSLLTLEKRYAKLKDPQKRATALSQLALLYAELAWVEKIQPIVAARLKHCRKPCVSCDQ